MVVNILSKITSMLSARSVPLSKIMMGGENDLPGYKYALLTGDYKRPSTLAKDGPHSKLLFSYREQGADILREPLWSETEYYKNARDCIDLFGGYFPGITSEEKIVLAAERFILLSENKDVSHLPSEGHSKNGELVYLAPIIESDCYQIIQGNHRVAFHIAEGKEFIKAKILLSKKQITLVQFLLQNLQWEGGEKILYQPLPCPELEMSWQLARQCTDRLERMMSFLAEHDFFPSSSKNVSVIDLGSYYGWFVSQFLRSGFDAIGVEKDNIAIEIGKIAYGNLEGKVFRSEMIRFLSENSLSYDVTCCLSILHHFIYGREGKDPARLLNILDKFTSKVMFFEMGEEHERWFSGLLDGWDAEKIESWILENTTFRKCFRLGRDDDGSGKFEGNFGRMLFAFVK
jgi:hypothetical protein